MNIANLNRARELSEKLKNIDNAIQQAQDAQKSLANTLTSKGNYGKIYEFRDGSGFTVDLDGVGMGIMTEMVEWLETTLKIKRNEVVKEIGTL